MFGIFKKASIHEPVEKQREEALNSVTTPFRSTLGRQFLNGLDCDQLPTGKGIFGSLDNPIPVNGAIGEIKYLVKLRGTTGEAVMFHRIGSMGSNTVENPVDCYEVVCMDGTQWNRLYFDCYHPRRSNIAPPGYTLVPFNKSLGMDIPYGFGCNEMVSNFPYDLPDAIIAIYGESPGRAIAKRVEERLNKHQFYRSGRTGMVPFYVIGPDGSETRHLRIGADIPEVQYKKLADPKTGALYGLTFYENGTPKTSVIPKQLWEQAKAQFGEIDRAGEEAMKATMEKFKNL